MNPADSPLEKGCHMNDHGYHYEENYTLKSEIERHQRGSIIPEINAPFSELQKPDITNINPIQINPGSFQTAVCLSP